MVVPAEGKSEGDTNGGVVTWREGERESKWIIVQIRITFKFGCGYIYNRLYNKWNLKLQSRANNIKKY